MSDEPSMNDLIRGRGRPPSGAEGGEPPTEKTPEKTPDQVMNDFIAAEYRRKFNRHDDEPEPASMSDLIRQAAGRPYNAKEQ